MGALDGDGFVKVYRRVMAAIYGHLRRRQAADTMATFVLLVLAADYRTHPGFIAGTLREIASELDVPRSTFLEHVKALEDAGEVEVTRQVNQHEGDSPAGIRVMRYLEIIGARLAAGRNPDQHAGRNPDQHRPKSGQQTAADLRKRAPEEVKESTLVIREALIVAFRYRADQITRTPAGWLTKAANDIAGAGGVPVEILARYARFEELHGRKPPRPIDLANAWPTLDSEKARCARDLRERLASEYGDDDADLMAIDIMQAHPDETDPAELFDRGGGA